MAATDVALSSSLKAVNGYTGMTGVSGEAVTAGMAVYRKAADLKLYKAICTALESAKALGIALVSAVGADQPLNVITEGELSNLSSLTVGEFYFVSDTTAGSLMKYSDIGAGEYACCVGQAKTASTFYVHVFTQQIAHG